VGRPFASNPAGAHFLHNRPAFDLVRLARPGPGDLVLDLGAGLGALTGPLAATGARVVAVEINKGYAQRLRDRFASEPNVTVVTGDLLSVALPRREFRVVANIPFATTAGLLRRLLDPPGTRLASAHLVVEWGAARRLVAHPDPWWAARFSLRRVRRLDRHSFSPPPAVDAEVLAIDRVPLPPGAGTALRVLLRLAAGQPHRPVRTLLRGRLGPGQLRAIGVDPGQPAGTLSPAQWRAIATCESTGNRVRGSGRKGGQRQ
jgi:23S rRNA (adenine-N6)-dimethyltransferase